MTYLQFLAVFVILPISLLAWLMRRHLTRYYLHRLSLLIGIALLYTTPWDNYLVAAGVWWYNPELVAGITLGWVPVEEYLFFILQPILTGLLVFYLQRSGFALHTPVLQRPWLRRGGTLLVGLIWLAACAAWLSGWPPATYLALQLVWALPPLMLQLAFGLDVLWHERRWVGWALAVPTLYLSLADTLAIGAGIWTINPALSLPVSLGGILPLEEAIFFLLTNNLIVFGLVLLLTGETQHRAQALFRTLSHNYVRKQTNPYL
jgi:lycopene cyclase domain-containing protein